MSIITEHGVFEHYNELRTDEGKVLKAFPYKPDFKEIYLKSGYFMLKKNEKNNYYTILRYILD